MDVNISIKACPPILCSVYIAFLGLFVLLVRDGDTEGIFFFLEHFNWNGLRCL